MPMVFGTGGLASSRPGLGRPPPSATADLGFPYGLVTLCRLGMARACRRPVAARSRLGRAPVRGRRFSERRDLDDTGVVLGEEAARHG